MLGTKSYLFGKKILFQQRVLTFLLFPSEIFMNYLTDHTIVYVDSKYVLYIVLTLRKVYLQIYCI